MHIFYIFRIWWLFLEDLQAVREPHTRINGFLGVNKPLIKTDYMYSSHHDERGYDYRYPMKNADGDTPEFADKITKLAQLKELQALSKTLVTSCHLNTVSRPEHTNNCMDNLNTMITPEYLNTCMRHIDENIYMNYKMAIGESSVLSEMSRFSSFNADKIPIPCPQDGTPPHFSNKALPVEPLNTRHSIYSVRNLQKGGLLDDFNREV